MAHDAVLTASCAIEFPEVVRLLRVAQVCDSLPIRPALVPLTDVGVAIGPCVQTSAVHQAILPITIIRLTTHPKNENIKWGSNAGSSVRSAVSDPLILHHATTTTDITEMVVVMGQ
ncbi:hypothetical protein Pelo_9726 [Pelomyxa schiedti]|nr:hypothetical protein Pelo_9726 [Pelomyxa schiedti]